MAHAGLAALTPSEALLAEVLLAAVAPATVTLVNPIAAIRTGLAFPLVKAHIWRFRVVSGEH